MKLYPMIFKAHAQTLSGIQPLWSSSCESTPLDLQMSIPPEFDGPGGGLSPEDLYLQALQNCFVATFKVFAEKSRLEYSTLRTQCRLFIDRNEKGVPWMAKFELTAQLEGAAQKENARRLLEKTSQSCMILNSVRTEKIFIFEIL